MPTTAALNGHDMHTPDMRTLGVAAHSAAHPHSSCVAVRWRASDVVADRTLMWCRSSAHEQATVCLASESLHARVPMSTDRSCCDMRAQTTLNIRVQESLRGTSCQSL